MASKRQLKKQIKFLAEELLGTQILKNGLENTDEQKTAQLVTDTIKMRNEFLARVNGYNKKATAKEIKAEFRTIIDDLKKTFNELADRTNKMA